MENWKNAAGEDVELPITPETEKVIVDPVPQYEGLINTSFALGFDDENRPIVSYHKYDEDDNSQIYNARWEEDSWEIYQTTDWDWRWGFRGMGALPCLGARPGSVKPTEDGYLSQPYRHDEGCLGEAEPDSGVWKLDPDTLQPVGMLPPREGIQKPRHLQEPEDDFVHQDGSRMEVRWSSDRGGPTEQGTRYYLRWESLGSNRDRPRSGELPDPSTLMLYELKEPN